MKLRIIQWNISFKSKPEKIVEFLLSSINKPTIVTLQEVLEPVHNKILSLLKPDASAYSLNHREPGKFEGKNRKMGVATYVFGGSITDSALISRSVFPERTLHTNIKFESTHISLLNFHSITGCDYKKAKSSNFSSIADYLYENNLDFFTCDANEPKVDSINDADVEFFDNKDKGKNAALILGSNKVHALTDSYKTYLLNNDFESNHNPLATSHIISKRFHRRYDHLYHSAKWEVDNVNYPYDKSINASSDHSAIIGDFNITNSDGEIMSEYSIERFIKIIERLPSDDEVVVGTQGYSRYRTQKAHWLGWLTKKPGAKYFRQDAPNREAKYVYNHIMEPKMLLYLISAVDIQSELIERAKADAKKQKSMAGSCAAIRKVVPWQTIEKVLISLE